MHSKQFANNEMHTGEIEYQCDVSRRHFLSFVISTNFLRLRFVYIPFLSGFH